MRTEKSDLQGIRLYFNLPTAEIIIPIVVHNQTYCEGSFAINCTENNAYRKVWLLSACAYKFRAKFPLLSYHLLGVCA